MYLLQTNQVTEQGALATLSGRPLFIQSTNGDSEAIFVLEASIPTTSERDNSGAPTEVYSTIYTWRGESIFAVNLPPSTRIKVTVKKNKQRYPVKVWYDYA